MKDEYLGLGGAPNRVRRSSISCLDVPYSLSKLDMLMADSSLLTNFTLVLLQPLQNNWFLYIIVGVTFLVLLSYITGSV